ncbi:hypothetical protein COV93_03080 [Candidatus Woesearchaeota archaeon CG11_big_fil_rev_8_21_14_0_20_43_8]|nr:MAG: hypothetical protein COV93_03080 [Candidatus Woesearchaeota archaeon CG11_big_fil_rev_8_21_14_0_20_43_8]
MVLESITGFATDTASIEAFAGFISAFLIPLLVIATSFFLGGVIQIVLFIMSTTKHKIEYAPIKDKLIPWYKKNYHLIWKRFIPVMAGYAIMYICFFIVGLMQGDSEDLVFGPAALAFSAIGFIAILFFVVYYFLINTSLARSYLLMKDKKFVFSWASGRQIFRVIILTAIFMLVMLIGLPFLLLPTLAASLLAQYAQFILLRYDLTVIESIKRGIALMRTNFWDMLFYVGCYGGVIFCVNFAIGLLGVVPLMSELGMLAAMVFVHPAAMFFLVETFNKMDDQSR